QLLDATVRVDAAHEAAAVRDEVAVRDGIPRDRPGPREAGVLDDELGGAGCAVGLSRTAREREQRGARRASHRAVRTSSSKTASVSRSRSPTLPSAPTIARIVSTN